MNGRAIRGRPVNGPERGSQGKTTVVFSPVHRAWPDSPAIHGRDARAMSLLAPLDEPLQGVELRQPQLVVDPGGVLVAVLGPLPELALVRPPREHRPVLLRLVPEDRLLLALQVL